LIVPVAGLLLESVPLELLLPHAASRPPDPSNTPPAIAP
jgi:hypothetical protein